MKYSLIIPCYNEAANLPLLLERCKTLSKNQNIEIIFVDNGSNDLSSQVLNQLLPSHSNCKSVRVEKNQGYGFGILAGLKAAQGDILGWTHADMQTDPKDLLQAMKIFEANGSQLYVKGKRIGRPLADSAFTIGMSIFETMLLCTRLWDINAQPNLFSRSFFESWENPPHDFSLDLYAYFLARHQGVPIYRFPVKFGVRAHGVSHWNLNWATKVKFILRTVNFSWELRKDLFKKTLR